MEAVITDLRVRRNRSGLLNVLEAVVSVDETWLLCSVEFMDLPCFDEQGRLRMDGVGEMLLRDFAERVARLDEAIPTGEKQDEAVPMGEKQNEAVPTGEKQDEAVPEPLAIPQEALEEREESFAKLREAVKKAVPMQRVEMAEVIWHDAP